MRSLLFLSILLLVLVASCAMEPPDWTRGQSSSYPSSDYLTAVGVSQDRNSAEKKARQELQQNFRLPSAAGGGEIEGVRIADIWHDRELDAYYALAVIDRHSAGQPLSDALAELERTIATQLTSAEAAGSPLLRWGYYLQAASLAGKRSELTADLRRIDPIAEISATAYSLRQVTELCDRAAAGVGMDIRLRNDRNDVVKQSLIRALAQRGLRLAPAFAAALRIHGLVAALDRPTGVADVLVRIEVDDGDFGTKLPPMAEMAEPEAVGEPLTSRVVAAVTALAGEAPL